MILKAPSVAQVVLVIRPGATEFDDQLRIKGSLDMPLSDRGQKQVAELSTELADLRIDVIYSSPEQSAKVTAEQIAQSREAKLKVIDAFRNLDHGLWHGKLIEEVKRNHPRLYKQGIDSPEGVRPPEGESIQQARDRATKMLRKCLRKNRDGVIAMVVPDPMASIIESMISGEELHDLWASEIDNAGWKMVEPNGQSERS